MRYDFDHDRYSDDTPACPICGSEDECSDPDACLVALENLRFSINEAPPNNPEDYFPLPSDDDRIPF